MATCRNDIRVQALAAGCTKLVDKPVTLEEMEKLLVGLLED